MALGFIGRLFDANSKTITQYDGLISQIDSWEEEVSQWPIEKFAQRTAEFRALFDDESTNRSFESDQKVLDELLPEAFAMVREVAKRVIGERSFREQLMVGIALHKGNLAEQKTGEGKTHAAVHPLYLNALTGNGAHLVTVNDYLARRDAEWMGAVFHVLGLSVGVINSQTTSYIYEPSSEISNFQFPVSNSYKDKVGKGEFLKESTRSAVYACDVTYGTNNEFGFDYLRDNMVQDKGQIVQTSPRGGFGTHHFAIVDEADSILIDEARTPLIISAPAEDSNQMYGEFAQLIPRLNTEDYVLDEKAKSAHLTDLGVKKIESWLKTENLYEDFQLAHHLDQALKAQYLYLKDRDYVVKDGEVIIVDTFTGRLMPGRRYSEGLHQAIEAKEKVPIQKESKTLATITFQNYFRLYQKLAGMSATVMTEAEEFYKIYTLDSVAVPTHKPVVRIDHPDRVYKNQRAKWKAITDEIEELQKIGQPVLAGTTSVEKNELLSGLLKRRGIPHEVLNAKNHEREAEIVARAGQKGAVTIATNMAGRGTDIKISNEVRELGGLFVIGTERHEARRIDNQLRGRSGRQGDPGASRFYVALDDDLMRIFNGDKIAGLMTRFNLPEDVPIEAGIVSKSIESSQKKVETYNFDIRKHLVEYDDVITKQREIIYERRRRLLLSEETENPQQVKEKILEAFEAYWLQLAQNMVTFSEQSSEEVLAEIKAILPLSSDESQAVQQNLENLTEHGIDDFVQQLMEYTQNKYTARETEIGTALLRQIERSLMLSTIDMKWMEHIDALDELRYGVRLRAYGQRDPLIEFKNEAFGMFERLLQDIDYTVMSRIFRVQVVQPLVQQEQEVLEDARTEHKQLGQFQVEAQPQQSAAPEQVTHEPVVKTEQEKIGRNDPCWCGSGKKYKHCGLIDSEEHQNAVAANASN